eukprot:754248-Hanusia_phi.AAC.1
MTWRDGATRHGRRRVESLFTDVLVEAGVNNNNGLSRQHCFFGGAVTRRHHVCAVDEALAEILVTD